MSRLSQPEYKELSQCAVRFGEGLGAVFNTGDRKSYAAFEESFNQAASAADKVKLAVIYAMHALSNQFSKNSSFSDRVKLQHAEAAASVAIRAFGQDKISMAIAPSDRTQGMFALCQRAGVSNLAKLIQTSLSQ